MADIMGIALGAAAGAGSSALGGIGRRGRERRQVGYQKELMGTQYGNQRRLNEQGQELGMKTWNETNYGAQMAHIKEAGLNPALMYGMSGGGGTTGGSPSGGGAASGGAPQVRETPIGNPVMGMQTLAQIKLIEAQAKNLDADTENKSEGGIVRGKAGEEIAKLIAETGTEIEKRGLVKAQKALAGMQAKNVEKTTEKIGKDIEVAEQERQLKKYEVDLNKQGIQKTDNKIFRYLTKVAADNGYTLENVIKYFVDKQKPMIPMKN